MLPLSNFKRRRPTKASFRFLSLLEEKEVGSRGKAPGRHPQTAALRKLASGKFLA